MKLPESFTKVTPFSKILAMVIFILFPILGFYLGILYDKTRFPQTEPSPVYCANYPPQLIYREPTPTNSLVLPSATPTITKAIIIENWKTFKDEKYNISFKYPENWFENNDGRFNGGYNYFSDVNLKGVDLTLPSNKDVCWEWSCVNLIYRVIPNKLIKDYEFELSKDPIIGNFRNILSGEKTFRYYTRAGLGLTEYYLIQYGNPIIEFGLLVKNNNESKMIQEAFPHILSSFSLP